MIMDCIFCDIISKNKPADIVDEDEKIIVIRDIKPKAPVHLLIISKKHISSVKDIGENEKDLLGEMILKGRDLAFSKEKLAGYKLIFNVGREGGQIIDHLHLHLLGGAGSRPDV